MKIAFIAGPYYGDGQHTTIEQNICDAEMVAIQLANRGIAFFCPHTHTRHFEEKAIAKEPFYHKLDRAILICLADAIVALPRRNESNGAKAEIALAKKLGITVFFLSSLDDDKVFDEIANWASE